MYILMKCPHYLTQLVSFDLVSHLNSTVKHSLSDDDALDDALADALADALDDAFADACAGVLDDALNV